uniref:Histone H1 n=1 Tax=Sphaeramia orbicularis TaxID=375764 RepID=A0A672ZV50_9TELE
LSSSIAPAPAAAPARPAKKKASKPAKKAGPSVGDLILKAVSASKERSGVSLAALKKALAAGGYDVDKNKVRVKTAVKKLVLKGALVQTKGTGASGSFKMSKKTEAKKLCTDVYGIQDIVLDRKKKSEFISFIEFIKPLVQIVPGRAQLLGLISV